MDTHLTYKINWIKKEGNKAILKYSFYSGYFQEVETEEGIFEIMFHHNNILTTTTGIFNYFPVADEDLNQFLYNRIVEYKNENNLNLEIL